MCFVTSGSKMAMQSLELFCIGQFEYLSIELWYWRKLWVKYHKI